MQELIKKQKKLEVEEVVQQEEELQDQGKLKECQAIRRVG